MAEVHDEDVLLLVHEGDVPIHRRLGMQDDVRVGAHPRPWAELAWNPCDRGIRGEAVDPSANAAAAEAYRRIARHLTVVVAAGPTSGAVVVEARRHQETEEGDPRMGAEEAGACLLDRRASHGAWGQMGAGAVVPMDREVAVRSPMDVPGTDQDAADVLGRSRNHEKAAVGAHDVRPGSHAPGLLLDSTCHSCEREQHSHMEGGDRPM